jgi:hypothetical protein
VFGLNCGGSRSSVVAVAEIKQGDLVRHRRTRRLFRLDVVNKKVFQGWSADGQWAGCGGPISFLREYELVTEPNVVRPAEES